MQGTFVAWLSTSTTDAISRLGSARGWVRPDGLPFADTTADLAKGHVFYPPQIDELGEFVYDPYVRTFTGTYVDGTRAPNTCRDWTSVNQDDLAEVGSGQAGGESWTDFWDATTFPCSAGQHLYCFQVDHQKPATVTPPQSARLSFVSSTLISVTGGVAAGDAACVKDGAAASLPGTYKALMGTSKFSPISRFNVNGAPWVRVDGVPIHLAYLAAPMDLHADGSLYDEYVFVGAADALGNTGDFSCDDWTSTDPQGILAVGMADWTYAYLFSAVGCDSGPRPVFCLQE
jgi:hypothetical protein